MKRRKKLSREHRAAISKKLKGRKITSIHSSDCKCSFCPGGRKAPRTAFKKGNRPYYKDNEMTQEVKDKIRNTLKGRKNPEHSEWMRNNQVGKYSRTKIEEKVAEVLTLHGYEEERDYYWNHTLTKIANVDFFLSSFEFSD